MYHSGDRVEFTLHLKEAGAERLKVRAASLILNGAVPQGELASGFIGDPVVRSPAPGTFVIAFKVGEFAYPGDYSLTVTLQTDDGTVSVPWSSQTAGIAPPVHIVNTRRLQPPTIVVDGLNTAKPADLPPAPPIGAASKITPADIRYMQGMVMHHGQAVTMCDLVRSHTDNPRLWELGRRIGIPQLREIGFMRNWLTSRGQAPEMEMPEAMPGMAEMDMSGKPMPAMPGMLTQAQMTALQQAQGVEFDKLFLAGMIQHHSGALVMTDDLFAQPGDGQEAELYLFARHVVTVQEAEIGLMQAMERDLKAPVTAGLPRHSQISLNR